jgi:molecular chaperone DnaK
MSKEDIDKAVKDAEQFAEEDKRRREEVDTRNEADQMVYQCEKILSEEGDKFDAADKSDLQSKIDALKNALSGQDINLIKSEKEALTQAFYKISEKLYQQAQAAQGGAQGGPQGFDPNNFAGGAQGGFNPNDFQQGGNGANGGYTDAGYTDANFTDAN